MEICWTILRFFGYDNDLLIKEDLWNDKSISDEILEKSRCFELKPGVVKFLSCLYRAEMQNSVFDQ